MNISITSREAILAVSKKLATEQGLQAINMRTVAGACNVAVGSVYNYFPSKADLIAATIEEVWKSVFYLTGDSDNTFNFTDRVKWIFESVRKGSDQYPSFFTLHSMSFADADKTKGRQVMNQYFSHMKDELLKILEKDEDVRKDAFNDNFLQEHFIDFVFSSLITLLMKNEKSCELLLEMIRRSIY